MNTFKGVNVHVCHQTVIHYQPTSCPYQLNKIIKINKDWLIAWFIDRVPKSNWVCISTLHNWLKKNSDHFFIAKSELKPKPIYILLQVTCSDYRFSCALFHHRQHHHQSSLHHGMHKALRFMSATCNDSEFWLVHCIVCTCQWPTPKPKLLWVTEHI